ncbi:hypothetical protein G6694_00040 [Polynucleobacter paneuropaeus]|nr:hypothetical protein [Polynucleobacter paneuropaeus]
MRRIKSKLKEALKKFVTYSGGVLISKEVYSLMLAQRNAACKYLLENIGFFGGVGMTGVVFSKDRPMQLFALLESYSIHVRSASPLKVIFNASSQEHRDGYQEVRSYFSESHFGIDFIQQDDSFKEILLRAIKDIKTKTIFFLVDDIIFTGDVDFSRLSNIDPLKFIFSLRLGSNIQKSYTTGVVERPPRLLTSMLGADIYEFKWFEMGNEWSDPWSLDGNFLSTSEVLLITQISSFSAPNSYEVALKTFNDFVSKRKGMCFENSKILNLPINKVQTEINNQSGNISTQFLLQQWQLGNKIDITDFNGYISSSPHEEHRIKFVRRLEA